MLHNEEFAKILLTSQSVNFSFTTPFAYKFSSGITSPVYCDNRILLGIPQSRSLISNTLATIIKKINILDFYTQQKYIHNNTSYSESTCLPNIIVGVATSGIPWATLCAERLNLPLCYARPKAKEYGTHSQFEGADPKNKNIIIIEDVITSAKSVLHVVDSCRACGSNVLGVISLFNYNFTISKKSFEEKKCNFLSLTSFENLASIALEEKIITTQEYTILLQWHNEIKHQDF